VPKFVDGYHSTLGIMRDVLNTFGIILLHIFMFERRQADTQTCSSQYFDTGQNNRYVIS